MDDSNNNNNNNNNNSDWYVLKTITQLFPTMTSWKLNYLGTLPL